MTNKERQAAAEKRLAEIKKKKSDKSGDVGSLLGTAIGAYWGPAGAQIGGKIGKGAGEIVGGRPIGEVGEEQMGGVMSLLTASKKGAEKNAQTKGAEKNAQTKGAALGQEGFDADMLTDTLSDIDFDDELLAELLA